MVFCRACGRQVHETAISCPGCGALQQHPGMAAFSGSGGTLLLPVPALILGIVVVLALFDQTSWDQDTFVGAFACSIGAVALGIAGISTQSRGRGMSIAGVVLGVIGFLGTVGRLAG